MSDSIPLRVLVIEDDADTRANLQDILELDNHEVLTAASAAEALACKNLHTISVIVLDRRLPDSTAEDLIPQLKSVAENADVIVVTGHADVESAILALRRGAADYIVKPINPDVLRASLLRSEKQQQLRAAKEQSEANFRELIEAMDSLVVILSHEHCIMYANRFAVEFSGYKLEELLGKRLASFIHQDSLAQVGQQLKHLHHGVRADEQEISICCKNGEERWVLWNVRLLQGGEGKQSVLAVGHDVTERRRLEQRALQAERLAAIGQMVTGLAHESRNALQRSQASLELLQEELAGQTEPLELVKRIQRAQHHLHTLYEEVRSYAAPITLRREVTAINHVWQETWANLGVARAGKQIDFREDTQATHLECTIDPIAMEQVFRNILENAIFVSQPKGEIVVTCRAATWRDQPAVEIAIRDHGPGLNAEQRERIFEPFYTTKTKGTGLGMAITRRIVEAHGGQIRVAQPAGPGAEIIILLPRSGKP